MISQNHRGLAPLRCRVALAHAGSVWIVMAFATLLVGCVSGGGAPPPDEQAPSPYIEDYTLGIGDALAINVWKNPELSVSVPVRPDGRISMPLIGDVAVGGRTPQAVADNIEKKLAEYVHNPRVSVIVTSVGSSEYLSRVRVTGAVEKQLSLPYRSGMTVMDVILEAGGPTEFANQSGTRLYRPGEGSRDVELHGILEQGDLSTNYTLRPGDVITVPETRF